MLSISYNTTVYSYISRSIKVLVSMSGLWVRAAARVIILKLEPGG